MPSESKNSGKFSNHELGLWANREFQGIFGSNQSFCMFSARISFLPKLDFEDRRKRERRDIFHRNKSLTPFTNFFTPIK